MGQQLHQSNHKAKAVQKHKSEKPEGKLRQAAKSIQDALPEERISVVELVILGVVLFTCLLLFYQPDITHTAVSSTSFFKGHILDFYTFNQEHGLPDSYMPSTYVVFAVWTFLPYCLGLLPEITMDIPFGVYAYIEILPVLFYLASIFVVYKIMRVLGVSKMKARVCTYATMTLPIALYSQFIFCQYDILTVFFVLLGMYFYFKNDDWKFVLFFAISFTFKYYAMAVFVPMLFLKHKNWLKIFAFGFSSLALFVIQILIYYKDPMFVKYVMNFSALKYVFKGFITDTAVINNGLAVARAGLSSIPINLILAFVICAWAYLKKPKDMLELAEWVFFLGTFMMLSVFGFMFWHPQWLLLSLPFYGMAACFKKRPWVFWLADFLFMVLFVVYVSNCWFRDLDQGLMEKGILGSLVKGQTGAEFMIKDFYLYHNIPVEKNLLTVMMGVLTVLAFPAFSIKKLEEMPAKMLPFIRLRWIGGLASFLVPAAICLYLAFAPPYCTFNGEDFAGHLPGITSTTWLSEVFTVKTSDVAYMEFYEYDYDRHNTSKLDVTIYDQQTDEIVCSEQFDTATFPNRGWIRMDLSKAEFVPGRSYCVIFNSVDATPENSVTLYHTHTLSEDGEHYYGMYTGQPLDSDLSIKIFESSRPK